MSDADLRALERAALAAPDDGAVLEALDRAQARADAPTLRSFLRSRLAGALRAGVEQRLRHVYVETYARLRWLAAGDSRPAPDLADAPDETRAIARIRGRSRSERRYYPGPCIAALSAALGPLSRWVSLTIAAALDVSPGARRGPASFREAGGLRVVAARAERIVRLALVDARGTGAAGPVAYEALSELDYYLGMSAALTLAGPGGAASLYRLAHPRMLLNDLGLEGPDV